jgi:hypothetical protein
MGLANKESILNSIDWDYDEFDVPGWGTVRIRALSAKERLEFSQLAEEANHTQENGFVFLAKVVMASIVDENGSSVFDKNADPQQLLGKNWNRIKTVADRILKFNGMDGEAIEDLEKN